MTTEVQEAPPTFDPGTTVYVARPKVGGEKVQDQAMSAADAVAELGAMQSDLDIARDIVARAESLEKALAEAMSPGDMLDTGYGTSLVLVQPEGARYVDDTYLEANRDSLVRIGVVTKTTREVTTYDTGGVAALSTREALAKMTAAGLDPAKLVRHRTGKASLVLTEHPTEEH